MDMDTLNRRVTQAIVRAEALEAEGPSADLDEAYLVVSFCEQEIAQHLPASNEEGMIARRGAVWAALTADLPELALELANRYAAGSDVPAELADELRELCAEAEARLDLPALRAIRVIPAARYHLQGAAA